MIDFSLENYCSTQKTCLAIGVFDGVHLGHQAVLRQICRTADEAGLLPVALTFDPHPAELVAPDRAPLYVCSLSQRIEWMTEPGLAQEVVVAHFDREFAELSAKEFIEQILVGKLRARSVRVGADFRFGKGRRGGVMELEAMGENCGFSVEIVHAVSRSGERVSSSRIRELIAAGDLAPATALLGRYFTLRGRVIEGKRLGRTIGYPTANLSPEMPRQLLPANGVYAGYARIDSGEDAIPAAISVGTNPTTDGPNATQRHVEAFLMDGFAREIYGAKIDLQFVERVRDEQNFGSVDSLIAQMDRDVKRIAVILRPDAGSDLK